MLFCLLSSFPQHNDKFSAKYDFIKVLMVCLGLEPGTVGWLAQTNPLIHGGTSLH